MQLASRVLVLVGALSAGGASQETDAGARTVEEVSDDGTRVERRVVVGADGILVAEGPYKSFRADGSVIAEGEFANGVEEGAWSFYHPDGALRAKGEYREGRRVGDWVFLHPDGSVEVEGTYQRGLRRGRWTYRDPDGKKTSETGTYKVDIETWENGKPKLEGERRLKYRHGERRWYREDGRPACKGNYKNDQEHGEWAWYWPDGALLLTGRFYEGERTGDWVFHHAYGAEGLADPGFLSGTFDEGKVVGRPDLPLPDEVVDLSRFSDPVPIAGLTGTDQRRLEELVRLVRAGTEKERSAIRSELVEWGLAPLPRALHYLKRLDLSREDDAGEASHLYRETVVPPANGHAFAWSGGVDPDAVRASNLALTRWLTLWALSRESIALWIEARATAPAEDASFLEDRVRERLFASLLADPWGLPEKALREEPWALPPWTKASQGELRARHGGAGTEEALDRALAWLAAHQEDDGRWDCDGFAETDSPEAAATPDEPRPPVRPGLGQPYHDVAVTGFALMAFAASGNTLVTGPHRKVVQDGVAYLQRVQDASGLFEVPERNTAFLYCHVIATWALADVLRDSRNPKLRHQVQAAVDALLRAQNPGSGWRYSATPDGTSDTSSTAWAVGALQMARRSGLKVDDSAFVGALAWFDSMTDKASARTGYQEKGSPSVRTPENLDYAFDVGETLTAASLWCRILMGQTLESHPLIENQAKLLLTRMPEWYPDAFGHDMIHWYFGTLAMFQLGDPYWTPWNEALRKTLLAAQVEEEPYAGSWDPVGPWGYLGGRVYSTAICAVTLSIYSRYDRVVEPQ